MLQKSDVRHSSGSRSPPPEIGQQQHRRRQNDQDKSQCEALDYKSHGHPRKKAASMGVEFTIARWPAQLPDSRQGRGYPPWVILLFSACPICTKCFGMKVARDEVDSLIGRIDVHCRLASELPVNRPLSVVAQGSLASRLRCLETSRGAVGD